jgi:prevent-host-death family protein
MPTSINVHEAKTNFSKLLDRAHGGEEIILAKAGKHYARLVPMGEIATAAPRSPGGLRVNGEIADSVWFNPMLGDDADAWEGEYRSNLYRPALFP